MNKLEKRSFYSFLALYIFSSFLLISLVGYWYYTSKKQSLESQTYSNLVHIIDNEASKIISAHMKSEEYHYMQPLEDVDMMLLGSNSELLYGACSHDSSTYSSCTEPKNTMTKKMIEEYPLGYHIKDGYSILVSDAPKGHLGIERIIVHTETLAKERAILQKEVLQTVALVMLLVAVIAWVLSRLFMRPIRERIVQVETFVNDVTHELNTPITSLSMATEQALKSQQCTTKTLNNISMSTKQLYDIYRSLTYLNFSDTNEPTEQIELSRILHESITYYQPLAHMKHIELITDISSCHYLMPKEQASLLFGNLIGNAIKYSSANSSVYISLNKSYFIVKDYGIGIEADKQKDVYQKYTRATKQSGGFGIGLNIVKSICEQYDIDIELDSVLGKYTEFKLKFGAK